MAKFSATNCRGNGSRRRFPRVLFGDRQIILSGELVRTFLLNKGDRISFYQSDTEATDWYIIPHDPEGFELRGCSSTKSAGSFRFSNAQLAEKVRRSLDVNDGSSFSVRVVMEPVWIDDCNMYPLITASAKKVK